MCASLDAPFIKKIFTQFKKMTLFEEFKAKFTAKELEIIQCIVDNPSIKVDEIANSLVVAPCTIYSHLRNIYSKIGVEEGTDMLFKLRFICNKYSLTVNKTSNSVYVTRKTDRRQALDKRIIRPYKKIIDYNLEDFSFAKYEPIYFKYSNADNFMNTLAQELNNDKYIIKKGDSSCSADKVIEESFKLVYNKLRKTFHYDEIECKELIYLLSEEIVNSGKWYISVKENRRKTFLKWENK